MGGKIDRTIQLKKFYEGEDDPVTWYEWRNVDRITFQAVDDFIKARLGKPMDRSGD
jgi:hypothetical protein